MPLDASRLAKLIEANIATSIKSRHAGAKPGKYLKKFSKGVALGFVLNAKGTTGKIAKKGGLGAPAVGVFGLKFDRLSATMRRECKKAFGTEGSEMKTFTLGISMGIVQEMGLASVMGTDGGTAKGFGKWVPSKMAKDMMIATGFKPTKYNKKFFKAIAEAITQEIRKYGQTAIPTSGPGSGPNLATLS